jgi:hypothetical protein
MTPNITDIIRHHVSLEVRGLDRLYLHAYMPKLQTSGGLCYFLRNYLRHPIPSPALFPTDARSLCQGGRAVHRDPPSRAPPSKRALFYPRDRRVDPLEWKRSHDLFWWTLV